jgi:RimJ/RimL family protein N-acetyltransferase
MNMPLALATVRPGLVLRSLVADDSASYAALLSANAAHLTRHGDYTDAVSASAEEHAAGFAAANPLHNFGIYESDQLVGSVTLVPVDPPRFGLGYLLAEQACGRGIPTLAVDTVARHAWERLAATDLFAGVTHGNLASVAVLHRVGFQRVATFDTYDRYHLDHATHVKVALGGSESHCKTSHFQLFMGVPPPGDRRSPEPASLNVMLRVGRGDRARGGEGKSSGESHPGALRTRPEPLDSPERRGGSGIVQLHWGSPE